VRKCAPRLSSRARAQRAMRRATSRILRASEPSGCAGRASHFACFPQAPCRRAHNSPFLPGHALRPLRRGFTTSPTAPAWDGAERRRAFPHGRVRRAPRIPRLRSELLASRLAPWTPVEATSPAANRRGTLVRPYRSVRTPPWRSGPAGATRGLLFEIHRHTEARLVDARKRPRTNPASRCVRSRYTCEAPSGASPPQCARPPQIARSSSLAGDSAP